MRSKLINTPAVKTKPKGVGKNSIGSIEAKISTGKTIFQFKEKATNNTKRKLARKIRKDKKSKEIKVVMDKEKIKS